MDRSRVVAIIPAHNESLTISSVVTAATEYVSVIVVDDASSDDTCSLAKAAGAIIVHNAFNFGYENSLNRGVEKAISCGFEYFITMDADGEHDPVFLKTFAELLSENQIPLVLGRRPYKQRFSEVIMGTYVKTRFGVHDILCGMKGYQVALVKQNGHFDSGGSIGTELAINSIRKGYDFREISISGVRRKDAPRFGGRLKANKRILTALWALMLSDIKLLFQSHMSPVTDSPKRR